MDSQQLIDVLRVELRTGFRSVTEKIGETNARLDQTNAKIDRLNVELRAEIGKTNARLDQNNARLDKLSEKVDRGFDGIGRYLIELEKHHEERISRLERRKKMD